MWDQAMGGHYNHRNCWTTTLLAIDLLYMTKSSFTKRPTHHVDGEYIVYEISHTYVDDDIFVHETRHPTRRWQISHVRLLPQLRRWRNLRPRKPHTPISWRTSCIRALPNPHGNQEIIQGYQPRVGWRGVLARPADHHGYPQKGVNAFDDGKNTHRVLHMI